MKCGKVSQTVLRRSVLKEIKAERRTDGDYVTSVNAATAVYDKIGRYAFYKAVNDLAAKGVEPEALQILALFPPETEEEEIRLIAREFGLLCKENGIRLESGHTEISSAVTRPVISVSAIGKPAPAEYLNKAMPGDSLILTRAIGIEGTAILAHLKEKELKEHFPDFLVDKAKGFEEELEVLKAIKPAMEAGAHGMMDLSQGGIFGALWEFGEASDIGMEVDLKKIPIRQETIEICDYLDVNPYELISGGSLLFAAPDGEGALMKLKEIGIGAQIIGRVTNEKARKLHNDGEVRYLDRAKPDEIFRVIG
jgi:hydrogenase expression/formation protein HypE